jgi:hypothetical protein
MADSAVPVVELPPLDRNLYALHYSCNTPENSGDRTECVTAVVAYSFHTGRPHVFSAFRCGLVLGVSAAEFPARLPELERRALEEFNAFTASLPDARWLHWGSQGPEVIAQRIAELHIEPAAFHIDQCHDLQHYLKLTLGDDFVPHPRLWHAIRLNLGAVPHLLDGEASAAAWRDGKYAALVRSAIAKAGAIAGLYMRVANDTLVTGKGDEKRRFVVIDEDDFIDWLAGMSKMIHAKPPPTATILKHGGRSYSAGGTEPVLVTDNENNILEAFLKAGTAMDTEELERTSGVNNVARVIGSLKTKYDGRFAPAIRTPNGKKGSGGYFIRVRES